MGGRHVEEEDFCLLSKQLKKYLDDVSFFPVRYYLLRKDDFIFIHSLVLKCHLHTYACTSRSRVPSIERESSLINVTQSDGIVTATNRRLREFAGKYLGDLMNKPFCVNCAD